MSSLFWQGELSFKMGFLNMLPVGESLENWESNKVLFYLLLA